MRRIATIDRQSVNNTITVWVTSASDGMQRRHVDPVVIDAAARPGAAQVVTLRELFAAHVDERSMA